MAPGFVKTPESLLQGLKRNDSKNPLTTCFGITASGRPCRRSLAAAVTKLNEAEDEDEESSVVAVVEEREFGSEITAFFCWQHKDQAASHHVGKARVMTLKTRNSLEDMLSSMGLEDDKQVKKALRDSKKARKASRRNSHRLQEPRETVATDCQFPTAPAEYTSDDELRQRNHRHRRDYQYRDYEPRRRVRHKKQSFWSTLFSCFDDDSHGSAQSIPPRPHAVPATRPHHSQISPDTAGLRHDSLVHSQTNRPAANKKTCAPSGRLNVYQDTQNAQHQHSTAPNGNLQVPQNRPPLRETHSQPVVHRKPLADRPTHKNKRWLSAEDPSTSKPADVVDAAREVIPKNASLSLASALMAEMAKVSEDTRQGYIYIYWLADAKNALSDNAGGSLLSMPPSPRRNSNTSGQSSQSLLLKIGRTDNVHRRLNQWNLQCGYKPLLVTSHPRPEEGIMVKHLHRVERLIHTELKEMNVKVACATCGKEHREWFEVTGREGVREVDKVVRRWVQWANRQPDS